MPAGRMQHIPSRLFKLGRYAPSYNRLDKKPMYNKRGRGTYNSKALQRRRSPAVSNSVEPWNSAYVRSPSVVQTEAKDFSSLAALTVTKYICNMCSVEYKHYRTLLTHQIKAHGREKKEGVGRKPKNTNTTQVVVWNKAKFNRTQFFNAKRQFSIDNSVAQKYNSPDATSCQILYTRSSGSKKLIIFV